MEKIIFILGSGHCGSTVLDKFLGTHNKVFSGGEIGNYTSEVGNNSLCSCESELSNCPFHRNLYLQSSQDKLQSKFRIKRNNIFSTFINILSISIALVFKTRFLLTKQTLKELFINKRIVDYIESNTKKSILVDSTKVTLRALLLDRLFFSKNHKCFYVLLVKNPLDVMVSKVKKEKIPLSIKDQRTEVHSRSQLPLKKGVLSWNIVNFSSLILLKLFVKRNRYTILFTKKFTSSPNVAFNEINSMAKIGVYNEEMTNLDSHNHHLIGGNASRINAKEVKHKTEGEYYNFLNPDEIEYIDRKTQFVLKQLKNMSK